MDGENLITFLEGLGFEHRNRSSSARGSRRTFETALQREVGAESSIHHSKSSVTSCGKGAIPRVFPKLQIETHLIKQLAHKPAR